jgi:predicted Zn-dependent protease
MDWWVHAAAGLVSYRLVPDKDSADVTIRFERRGETGYAGLTEYRYRDDTSLVSAATALNLSYLSDARAIPAVAAHEFGHALGIAGHSPEGADLMSATTRIETLARPSLRDLNTLRTAYASARSAQLSLFRRLAGRGRAPHADSIRCAVAGSP